MLIGRVLMSAIFIWSGFGKLVGAAAAKAYMVHMGVPVPELAWIVTVVIEFVGGLALLLGLRVRLLGALFALWCLVTAFVAHLDFSVPGNNVQFMKNIAMCGGFIYIALFGGGIYTVECLFHKKTPVTPTTPPSNS
ncbi:DoxX family protein [Govanella unica]|uniref:DoxX family protein n=1 Tax=Govanella unica TaxID=2975056 RepID=A0A9X3TZW3_9PROT|nr:DoxX family protein [Govania unica]MDA5194727.1 DoxX family protein [Govania unica]